MKIQIKNGRVIDPASDLDQLTDLHIADGKIIGHGKAPDGFVADRIIRARGLVVCPGFIDLRAHLREPGHEHKATIASETAAAASAGITTLCCPPDTDPVVDSPAVATLIRDQAATAGLAHVLPLGAMTQQLAGAQLSEMAALKNAGCIGISNGMRPLHNLLIVRRAMEYAATHDLTVFIHAEEDKLANGGCVHEGAVGSRLGLSGIPAAAETVAVAANLALIEEIGVRAHFSMLSTARATRMIARAQFDGLPVTADVTAHHLHLTEYDILDFDSQCHVRPPLRTQRDCEGLRQALAENTVSAICSDHQPHEGDAKLNPFALTVPGLSGLETLLPLSLKLVDGHNMSLKSVIERLTAGPAEILNIDAGTLGSGRAADICVFDPDAYWTLNADTMVSRGRNTPFLNWELKGRVTHTLVDGRIVYENKNQNKEKR